MRNVGCKDNRKGVTLAVMTAVIVRRSRIYRKKPNPPAKSQHQTKKGAIMSTHDLRIFLSIWAGIFAVFLLSGVLLHDHYRIWAIIGLALALALQAYPKLATPLYIAQIKVGSVMGWCISRASLVVLYFCVFVPLGLVFKLARRDILAPKLHNDSYFITDYWRAAKAATRAV